MFSIVSDVLFSLALEIYIYIYYKCKVTNNSRHTQIIGLNLYQENVTSLPPCYHLWCVSRSTSSARYRSLKQCMSATPSLMSWKVRELQKMSMASTLEMPRGGLQPAVHLGLVHADCACYAADAESGKIYLVGVHNAYRLMNTACKARASRKQWSLLRLLRRRRVSHAFACKAAVKREP